MTARALVMPPVLVPPVAVPPVPLVVPVVVAAALPVPPEQEPREKVTQ